MPADGVGSEHPIALPLSGGVPPPTDWNNPPGALGGSASTRKCHWTGGGPSKKSHIENSHHGQSGPASEYPFGTPPLAPPPPPAGAAGAGIGGNWGQTGTGTRRGTDGTFHWFSFTATGNAVARYLAKPNASCLSAMPFAGRPPCRGVKRRPVSCSIFRMNSAPPSGRPV